MPTYMARAIIHTDDNIPANFSQNQFCIDVTGDPEYDDMTAAIKGFYDDIDAINWSNLLAQNGHEVKFYALPGLTPNYPTAERTFNFAANPSGNPLPTECAIVASFQGSRTPGFEQARRRGRVYLGPLGSGTNDAGRPGSGIVAGIVTAMENFRDAVNAISGHSWCVWSTVDQEAVPITSGWVDNAWDTQRRRGLERTSRNTWTT